MGWVGVWVWVGWVLEKIWVPTKIWVLTKIWSQTLAVGGGWIITTLMPTLALTTGSYNRAECGNKSRFIDR